MLASGIVGGLRRLESSTDTELDKLERTSLEKQTYSLDRKELACIVFLRESCTKRINQ